jgi:hypothetical protein
MIELTVGYERNKGVVYSGLFKKAGAGPSYVGDIKFLIAAKWECDAAEAIERKARPILDHLAKAVRQLPYSTPSAIHVGIEALDGDSVEKVRHERIKTIVGDFTPGGKPLYWIYCHLLASEVPPYGCWALDETTYPMRFAGARGDAPLQKPSLVLPHSVTMRKGPHWYHGEMEWKD